MKLLKRFVFLSTALVITSCAFMQPRLLEIQIPPERIAQKGYSFMPLNEQGWLVVRNSAYEIDLKKHGENPDETYVIQAITFRLPAFTTHEEFAHLVKDAQAKNTDSQRFEIMKHEINAYNYSMHRTDCVKSHIVTEDKAAVTRSGKSVNMVLEQLTLVCAHPNNKNVGISISYSRRYYPDQSDTTFINKATSVLNSVYFTEL